MHARNVFCINYEQRLAIVTQALAAAERDQRWSEAESLRMARSVLEAVLADRRLAQPA